MCSEAGTAIACFDFLVYIWDGRVVLINRHCYRKERFSASPGGFEYLLALFACRIVISPQDRVATIEQEGPTAASISLTREDLSLLVYRWRASGTKREVYLVPSQSD